MRNKNRLSRFHHPSTACYVVFQGGLELAPRRLVENAVGLKVLGAQWPRVKLHKFSHLLEFTTFNCS